MSAGDGSKGPRWYDWALATLPAVDEEFGRPGRSRWLLLRRSITDPEEVAFYLCAGPAATTLQTLVVAGSRWAIESCFQQAKTETGLDHYQVRRYQPWYRHITLAMLASAYLAVVAATDPTAAGTWSVSALKYHKRLYMSQTDVQDDRLGRP